MRGSAFDHIDAAKRQIHQAEGDHEADKPSAISGSGEQRIALAQAHATIAVAEGLEDLVRAMDARAR